MTVFPKILLEVFSEAVTPKIRFRRLKVSSSIGYSNYSANGAYI
jgi:hypothetical protein